MEILLTVPFDFSPLVAWSAVVGRLTNNGMWGDQQWQRCCLHLLFLSTLNIAGAEIKLKG